MKNVLITGASGFIGSFLVEEGLKRGFNVFAGLRRSSSRGYLQDPRIRFVEFDFSTVESISGTLTRLQGEGVKFDYVIHNAGVTKAKRKEEFSEVNHGNTKRLIEALTGCNLVPEKFIFISSLAAYGPGDPDTGKPVTLDQVPKPIELYGRSKLQAEQYITSLDHFPWIIMRPTGVYGPREKDYFVFFQTIGRGLEPYIGYRKQILTFIYVKDLVRVIFDAMLSPVVRKAYFVSDGGEYDGETFAAITKRIMGKKTFRFTVPLPVVKFIAVAGERIAGLWGAVPTLNSDKYNVLSSSNWRCEHEPLQRDFGFKAEYDLEKGVREAVAWYKQEGWL